VSNSLIRADLLSGEAAAAWWEEKGLIAQWRALLEECPWATSYQSPQFACAWYRTYASEFEAMIFVARDNDGDLKGLLPLARPRNGAGPPYRPSDLLAAGGHQAEYQIWICRPEDSEDVARAVVDCVRRLRPKALLTLHYLPPGVPLGALAQGPARRCCVRLAHRRPVLVFGDGSDVASSLAKSGNKSRLRQLRKRGEVTLTQLTDPEEFATELATAATFHDIRQLAARGSAPFRNDPQKETFHRALHAEQWPLLVHATVLRVGNELASFHANMITRDQVQLSFIAHNPAMERLSPGKLHVLLLAQLLHRQGYRLLDLTPGDEPYKDRFANSSDEVHTLAIYSDPLRRSVGAAMLYARFFGKRAMRGFRLIRHRVLRRTSRVRPKTAAAPCPGTVYSMPSPPHLK
jgi:CelD/BcsL family acetyltransferase involved in cellulose biosynthesis